MAFWHCSTVHCLCALVQALGIGFEFFWLLFRSVGSGGSSLASHAADQELRARTLEMCGASARDFEVVLTSGATAALQLVRVHRTLVS